MHNYHEAYGVFPPRVVYGKDGIPMHSWRVLLLPYVEECKDYYAAYDFSRPWNSWTNRRLLEKVPDCYVCPEDSERRAGETSYVAVYGDHSVWDRPEEAAAAVLAHDPEAITGIAVVETRQRGFLWTEPKDIRIDQFVRQCGVTGAQTGRTSSRLGTNVVCLNCLVYGLPKTTQPAAIRAMISVVGGMSMKNARQYLKEPFRE